MLAALSFIRFYNLDEMRIQRSPIFFYIPGFLFFICALFSKTVTLSLPAVIILLIWWKRGKISFKDIYPLIPMVVLGVLLGLNTVAVEKINDTAIMIFFAIVILTFSFLSWNRGLIFNNPESLWADNLKKNPESFTAHNNLGKIFFEKGQKRLEVEFTPFIVRRETRSIQNDPLKIRSPKRQAWVSL